MIKRIFETKSYSFFGILTITLTLLIVPLLCTFLINGSKDGLSSNQSYVQNPVRQPRYINVHITSTGKTIKVRFEEYVTCVTASEVPSTFHSEAIKAQSVAARTYALAKIEKYKVKHPSAHPDSPICDSTHCQVYRSEKELIKIHDKGWDKVGLKKIKKAVNATKGQVMYYDGKLVMQPLFFSSSGGKTENSQDVFSSAYPYLKSVSSPYESSATHQNEKKIFSLSLLKKTLSKELSGKDFSGLNAKTIKVLSRTKGGRVDKIKFGNVIISGMDTRNALGLSSSLFTVKVKDEKVIFTSNGSGHGVGLSQHGANGMANEGFGYIDILKHYYSGVDIM